MTDDVQIDDITEDIYKVLRKHFNGYVEINHLNARQETREDLEKLIIRYYEKL